jgi:subtilisin family serine protease
MRLRRWRTALLLTLTLLVSACGGPGFTADGDPLAADQYAIDQHGMERAWTRSSGADVVIAIVDTGIDLDHPDLADRIVAGYDFVDDDDVPDDQNGHGTHVAGSAAAIGNNDIGVIGMAPEAKIMPLKVLAADGSGSVEDVAAAITWAADNGADVINLSLGGSSNLLGRLFNKVDPTNTAIADAVRKGAVVVAAQSQQLEPGSSRLPRPIRRLFGLTVRKATSRWTAHPWRRLMSPGSWH